MSKILEELMKAAGLDKKRGEDRQALLMRTMLATKDLPDAKWDNLSQAAQDWFNDAADAKNAKADKLPEMPDLEEEEAAEEKPASRRRGADKGEEKEEKAPTGTKEITADDVEKGMAIRIVTKRGKDLSGTVTGVDEDGFTLKTGDDEDDFDFSRIDKIFALDTSGGSKRASKAAAEEEEAEDPIREGVTVSLKTKRGKEATGKIVELTDEVIVLDVDGKEEEFARDRVESIKPVGGKKAEPAASGRRGASKGEDKPADGEKAKRVSNEGVSIGTRIKELIADNLDATEEQIAKLLKKEDLEFKDNTLKLNFVDAHKFVTILRAKKLLK